jgi:hypothetical protein
VSELVAKNGNLQEIFFVKVQELGRRQKKNLLRERK